MISAEQILTVFFIACSVICWLNVRALLRDKCVKGVSAVPTCVFIVTNIYEAWYFHHLHQSWATLGSFSMLAVNLIWLVLFHWYRFEDWAEDQLDLLG